MKVTFVSNYMNHHQMPVSDVLYDALGDGYRFIQTQPMEEERLQMGWAMNRETIPYLKCFYEEPRLCETLIAESDAVIFGGTDDESYIAKRLKAGKLVIRYSERLYKTGQWKAISPRGLRKKYLDHTRYRKSPVYLLCAGGYVPSDFHIVRAYSEKMLKWGYFPATMELEPEKVWEERLALYRQNGITQLLWAGRFLDWKHPELPILLARYLKQKKYKFHLTMIGGGEMEPQIRQMVEEMDLGNYVTLAGFQSPTKVRESMLKSSIYLFTSDYQEGWGAVLNEAMNSACAVVTSHAIGATPYLVRHGENGMIFKSGQTGDFFRQVEKLLLEPERMQQLGREAYHTIAGLWNAKQAGERLLTTIRNLQMQDRISFYGEGPCSRAEVIKERRMFRHLRRERE